MLPLMIKLVGIGPYISEEILFESISGDVVAITGENGSGKSFLLDSVYCSLYRFFPSRDSIFRYCKPKSQISFEFKIGETNYRTVLNIDSKKREIEPFLFKEGQAITDGKNTTFDKEIEKICGPSQLVLASSFSAQNKKGSFVSLPKAERKKLFIEMLGLGRLQVISESAVAKEKESEIEYDKLSAKADGYRTIAQKQVPDTSLLYDTLEKVKSEISTMEADIKLNSFEVGILKAKFQGIKDIEMRKRPIQQRKQSLVSEIGKVKLEISNAEALAASIPRLKETAEKYESVNVELGTLRNQKGSLANKKSDHYKNMAAHSKAVKDLESQVAAQKQIVVVSTNAIKRAKIDSAIIDTVPCHAEGECADCQFLVNATKAKDTIVDLETKVDESTASMLALEGQIKALPVPDTSGIAQIESRMIDIDNKIKLLEAELISSNNAKSRLAVAEASESTIVTLNGRLESLLVDSRNADEEIAEVDALLVSARESEAEYIKANRKLDLDQEVLEGSRRHMNSLVADISNAEALAVTVKAAQEEIDKITPELARIDLDRKSWNLLAKAFGKTGIQSLEIDSAGPSISEIVNNLLFSCFGPRFSVRFLTQILKDDKSGYKDDFDVYVTDAETGREGSIDDLSGGEKVIVGEAISLAICLFNSSCGKTRWESLWRDEASSAVDDKRAPMYISMLRKAREIGGYKKLLFISHQNRANEGADSKIIVSNGKVSFE